jgi:fumarylacetoacetate (FAA) hydrolase family protein
LDKQLKNWRIAMNLNLTHINFLPDDRYAGTLVGRVWQPGSAAGPCVVVLKEDGVFDITPHFPSMSTLLESSSILADLEAIEGVHLGSVEQLLANTDQHHRDPWLPYFLAPCDLQVIKACGVTFAVSMIERVIEEQAAGDATQAQNIRLKVQAQIGCDLSSVKPGSDRAIDLKKMLQAEGIWSQYLEVGIGPDAEVFTKAPVLSAIGTGSDVGIRSESVWNNPEPEIVLAVNSRGQAVGASLGNDVNLRDIEGRSALLLGKAKDNNASCAIGPFIRIFDSTFNLDHVRQDVLHLTVHGTDGFAMQGINSMAQISRDPLELVDQVMSAHQYPDGFMLFLGTLFAPTQDRDQAGQGFTHKLGDEVSIRSKYLGELKNRVAHSEFAPPWRFGLREYYNYLARRISITQSEFQCL